MNLNIAVLITCYNRKQKTLNCLTALFAQKGYNVKFNIEVFLVDDGSTDGTYESVAKMFPNVNLITGTGDLYWNRGMHLAWFTANKKQEYDFYLWLNDDVEIFEDGIVELLQCYDLKHSEAIICGEVCSKLTHDYTYGGSTRTAKPVKPNGLIQECDIINGNCVLISKKAFATVGTIDPIFPHAIGDYDYGRRATKKGIKLLVTRKYIGYCEKHDRLPIWCLPETPIRRRIKSLYSPLGNSHPYYYFIYEKRHEGIFVAIKHYFSIHLRAFIPTLWK